MRVVFLGTPEFATSSLELLLASRHRVVGLVCQPDRPKGRSREPVPPDTKICAINHSLEIFQPKKLGGRFLEWLSGMKPDVLAVVAYGRIIPPAVLEATLHGCVNLHPSLLPRYRGAAPIQWAIANGEKTTGVSIMRLDEGMDTGPVFAQQRTAILPDDTAESLHDRLSRIGGELLVETLDRLERGGFEPTPQDDDLATEAPPLKREDGRVDWGWSGERIVNRVRGFHPWPGTWTACEEGNLKLFPPVKSESCELTEPPGTILGPDSDGGLLVRCGDGRVCFRQVQAEGRKRMPAEAWLRGLRGEPGRLG